MADNAPIPPVSGSSLPVQPLIEKTGTRHSLHHCYIWLGTLRIAPVIYACGLSSLSGLISLTEFLGFASTAAVIAALLILLAITLVVCAVVLGVRAWMYRHTWYEFDKTEFSFYAGIFSKRRTHVPYAKVQSVNERASLLQRLVGVCTVTIDTAGGASNKAVMVSYVERSAAEYLRRELFLRKRREVERSAAPAVDASFGTPATTEGNVLDSAADAMDGLRGIFGKDEVDTGAVACEYRLSNKELLLAVLCSRTSFGLAFTALVFVAAAVLSFVFGSGLLGNQAAYAFAGMSKSEFLALCLLGGLSIAWCLGLAWVIYAITTFLSYGGFCARRRGNRIEVERGIVTHVFSGIDVARIQSVHIHQTFFQRLLKCCSISYGRVGAASGDASSGNSSSQQETEKLVVHPYLPRERAEEFVAALTPEYAAAPGASVRLPKVALRRALTRRVVLQNVGFWLAVCIALLLMAAYSFCAAGAITPALFHDFAVILLVPGLSICLLAMAVEAAGAVLWHRRSAFGFDTSGTTVVNGGYSTDTVVVPRKKMQYACVRTNPLQRHAQVATVMVRTAAGIHGRNERLIDIPATDAAAWLAWAQPGNSQRL